VSRSKLGPGAKRGQFHHANARTSKLFLVEGTSPISWSSGNSNLADPESVADQWRAYYDRRSGRDDEPHAPVVSTFVDPGKRSHAPERTIDDGLVIVGKQVAAQWLTAASSTVGTRKAKLNPLLWTSPQAAATAAGYHSAHLARQAALISRAFTE
jgi:hypothetical protein